MSSQEDDEIGHYTNLAYEVITAANQIGAVKDNSEPWPQYLHNWAESFEDIILNFVNPEMADNLPTDNEISSGLCRVKRYEYFLSKEIRNLHSRIYYSEGDAAWSLTRPNHNFEEEYYNTMDSIFKYQDDTWEILRRLSNKTTPGQVLDKPLSFWLLNPTPPFPGNYGECAETIKLLGQSAMKLLNQFGHIDITASFKTHLYAHVELLKGAAGLHVAMGEYYKQLDISPLPLSVSIKTEKLLKELGVEVASRGEGAGYSPSRF